MSKAHLARLTVGILGVVAIGLAISVISSTAWIFVVLIVGFVLTSMAAERAFKALATPEERRRDLKDRARNTD